MMKVVSAYVNKTMGMNAELSSTRTSRISEAML